MNEPQTFPEPTDTDFQVQSRVCGQCAEFDGYGTGSCRLMNDNILDVLATHTAYPVPLVVSHELSAYSRAGGCPDFNHIKGSGTNAN